MSTNDNTERQALKAIENYGQESYLFAGVEGENGERVDLISPQQWQAVQLLVAGRRQVAIAEELGVTQETISRWRSDPCFQAALNFALRDSYITTIGGIRDARTEAVEVLRELLHSENERVRLSAAMSIIKLHLTLDADTVNLPTTPAAIADERQREALFNFSFGV